LTRRKKDRKKDRTKNKEQEQVRASYDVKVPQVIIDSYSQTKPQLNQSQGIIMKESSIHCLVKPGGKRSEDKDDF